MPEELRRLMIEFSYPNHRMRTPSVLVPGASGEIGHGLINQLARTGLGCALGREGSFYCFSPNDLQ